MQREPGRPPEFRSARLTIPIAVAIAPVQSNEVYPPQCTPVPPRSPSAADKRYSLELMTDSERSSEHHIQGEVARGRAPLGLWTWVWALLLSILVAPPFYSFNSIAASFAEFYGSFGSSFPSVTKSVLASSASIAADLRIALGTQITLLNCTCDNCRSAQSFLFGRAN